MTKTDKKKIVQVSDFQRKFEKILQIAVFVLAGIHMTLVPFRYAVDILPFQLFELWFGLIIVLIAAVYLSLTKIIFPNTWFRIKALCKKMSCYEQYFMIGLVVWSVIICWYYQSITGDKYIRAHDWIFFDMTISALVLLPMAKFLEKDKAKRRIEFLLHVVIGSYTIFTLWSLWNIFHLHVITLPSGGQIGMDNQTRLYLGCHYNITGAIALTMLAVCIYMILQKQKVLKAVYIIAAAAHVIIVMLSNSRTVFIAGLVMIAAAAFLFSWNLLGNRSMRVRICAGLAAACVFSVIFWSIRPLTFSLFEHITHYRELLGSSQSIPGELVDSSQSISGDVRKITDLNGRSKIWIASLKVMFSSVRTFLFGVTLAGTTPALTRIGGITFEAAHAHNAVLQVGVAFGVPAMIAFIIFLICIFMKSIRILFVKNEQLFCHAYMVPVVILCLVVMNLAEAYLVGYYAIMSSVFFLFCGWVLEMGE